MPVCGQCRADNAGDARFCNQCGTPLAAAAPAQSPRAYTPRHLAEKILQTRSALVGERKRVTVLFVDLKGSTQLAEEAGAEAWHNILDRYFTLLAEAVHRYEGTINQYTGDGIMALFGAPIAHEDHARRACLAALDAQRTLRSWADELRVSMQLNVSMRAGLNSGEVVVGRIGDDLRMDYTAQGLTVNLAARMEHICEPGRVTCTRATAALVEGYLALRDLGEMSVAGASAPVRVYEVQGEGAIQTRLERQLARGAASFIGRERELAALRGAMDEVRRGRGRIVAVVGDAGIGKSRLCHEFVGRCAAEGVAVHRATGVPYASALPLLPVLALTRSRLGLREQATPAEARRLVAGSLMLFDAQAGDVLDPLLDFLGVSERSRSDPVADRQKLFEFLARFLPHAETPQVLLVEDLHFADAGTEDLLADLARRVAGTATLLVLNFRPTYAAQWLATAAHQRLALDALDDAALERLALEMLGADAAMPALAVELRRRAAGNPLFVEEAVQALCESGHLDGARGAHRLLRTVDDWPIPDTIHALLAARIDRLEEPLKILLQCAAVVGQEFDCATLAALAGGTETDCAKQIGRLCAAGLVGAAEASERFGFVHPLIQEVAYTTQLEKNRRALHAQLAARLESIQPLNAPPTAQALMTAHHWQQAGEWARAGAWNLQAARWAVTRDGRITDRQWELAAEHLARAIRSTEVDHLRVTALAGLLRQAQFATGAPRDTEALYKEGCRLAEESGDGAGLGELYISYAVEQMRRGDAQAAVEFAERGVQQALSVGATDMVGRFRLALLLIASTAGYPRQGIAMINRAGGADWLRGETGEHNYLSRGFYGYMLGWLGRLEEGSSYLAGAIDYAERVGASASWMYANRVELACLTGEPAGVLQQARLALERAEAFGSPYFRSIALRALGNALMLQEQHAQALPLLEQALPLVAPGAGGHQFEAGTKAALARACIGSGDPLRGFALAREAIDSAQRSHSRLWEIVAWLALFTLPARGPWETLAREGIARVAALLELSGAESARPWWWLAQERWAPSKAAAAEARQGALQGFAAIGAVGYLRRFTERIPAEAAALEPAG